MFSLRASGGASPEAQRAKEGAKMLSLRVFFGPRPDSPPTSSGMPAGFAGFGSKPTGSNA